MSGTIDYAPLLPTAPPEGMEAWARAGAWKEYLIYRAGRCYVPLEERWEQAVEIICTSCHQRIFADKIRVEDGCGMSRPSVPFGWHNQRTGESLISGDETVCPCCGTPAKTVHTSKIPSGIERCKWVTTFARLPIPGERDRLALVEWRVKRCINKQGEECWSSHLWDAFVVDDKKVIHLAGHKKWFATVVTIAPEQRKRYEDRYGEYELIYPWDPALLEGTTAEHCKLDRYIAGGGKRLVSYLALWRKRPAVENLIVQGCTRLVDGLIGSVQQGRSTGIPKLPLDWAQTRPNELLYMSKEEFRQFGRHIKVEEFEALELCRRLGVQAGAPDAKRLAGIGAYDIKERVELAGAKNFWKATRYLDKQKQRTYTLRDYWRMADLLHMDLDNDRVRWPKDLKSAHDKAAARYKRQKSEQLAEKFAQRLAELERYAWQDGDILIRPCGSEEELIQEGKDLNHCVASYAERHANGETAIFFIRRAGEPDKPWYTLELDEKALYVRQNRGKRNCGKTDEVQSFEDRWLAWVKGGCKKKKEDHAA